MCLYPSEYKFNMLFVLDWTGWQQRQEAMDPLEICT